MIILVASYIFLFIMNDYISNQFTQYNVVDVTHGYIHIADELIRII